MIKTAPIFILVAEDDAAHATAIERAFEAEHMLVGIQVVGSLREFRVAAAARVPDLALVDLNLPDGRAVEVLASPPESGQFPVLIMTSQGSEQAAVQAIKAGALDYTVKSPEAFAAMPQTVERALREWKLLQAHRNAVEALRQKNTELQEALAKVKALSGLLPICAGCKQIRDDKGYWSQVENYIQAHSDVTFTHGLCPKCAQKYFPGLDCNESDEEQIPDAEQRKSNPIL
ncbi:MAG: response regulator [Verrucomicrobia bacterium]|nr:response regulator [Verrucomicrobiota bacterium]